MRAAMAEVEQRNLPQDQDKQEHLMDASEVVLLEGEPSVLVNN